MIDLNEGASAAVIALNEVWQPPPRYDLAEVRARLAATARDWLPALFPNARLSPDKKTLRCADLSGRPPRKEGSCVIHLEGALPVGGSITPPARAPARST